MPAADREEPSGPALQGVRAVVFDAYGTLFDVASASERASEALGAKWQPLAELWRAKQLQYTWLRSLMGRHADFWRVTGDALDYAMEALGVVDAALRARLMDAVRAARRVPRGAPGARGAPRGEARARHPVERRAAHARRRGRERGDRAAPRRGPLGGAGRDLQAEPGGLPARPRSPAAVAGRGPVRLRERVGRLRREGVGAARRLVQPRRAAGGAAPGSRPTSRCARSRSCPPCSAPGDESRSR